jgi:hypothetical protein
VRPRRCAVRRRRAEALLLIALWSTACQAWHTERVTPGEVLATRQPPAVRVTRIDGSQTVLERPLLRGDTLVGIWHHDGNRHEVRLALTDVRQIATRRFSVGRTAGLGVFVTAGVLAALLVAVASSCSGHPSPCST